MMLRPGARLVTFVPLIFAALFAGRTLLGQTATTLTEEERTKRLQFLKARGPELRPLESGPSESTAAAKPSAPAPAAESRTAKTSTAKTPATKEETGKATTAKSEATKKAAPGEKPAATTPAVAQTAKASPTPSTKKTASAATPAPESRTAKQTASKESKTSGTTAKAASEEESSEKSTAKKVASTEKSSTKPSESRSPTKTTATPAPKIADSSATRASKTTTAKSTAAASLTTSATDAMTPASHMPKTSTASTRSTEAELADLRITTMKAPSRYPWKCSIVTTVFWVGERPAGNNFTPNYASSWDAAWTRSYGGFDNPDPDRRRNFVPVAFTPRQNNFYVALPYNDVTRGTTKPEARRVIPWFKDAHEREGQSVCHNRWVAIRSRSGRIAYAQWSDCGPFRTDHWQYVFGSERPKPNLNQGAGLDVSPAVRDFLGLQSTDVTDWKFVDVREVPHGPWALYGDNNTCRKNGVRMAKESSRTSAELATTR